MAAPPQPSVFAAQLSAEQCRNLAPKFFDLPKVAQRVMAQQLIDCVHAAVATK